MRHQSIDLTHAQDRAVAAWIAAKKTGLRNGVVTPIDVTSNPSWQLQRRQIHHISWISIIWKGSNTMAGKQLLMKAKGVIKAALIWAT